MRIQTPAKPPFSLTPDVFAPLRPHTSIPLFPEWAIYAFAAGAILLLVLVFWLMRGGKTKPLAARKINPLNEALEALRALEPKATEMETRIYSSAVSDILRGYIEHACSLPAQEQTTEEFLHAIQEHPLFDEATRDGLEEFLELCDLAKFAQQSVEVGEKQRLLKQARELIETLYRSITRNKQNENRPASPPPLPKEAATA